MGRRRPGQELLTLKGHTNAVISVAFSPDGKRIASASEDRTVKVWDAADRPGAPHPQGAHRPTSTAWRSAPTANASPRGSDDKTVKVWDAATGQEVLTLKGHTSGVTSVAFSPDGKRIASGSEDRTVKVWDAADRPGSPHPQGTHGRRHRRGVQPRRQTHRLGGSAGQDGEGLGRRRPARRPSPSRATPAASAAWRSAPTANASPPGVRTRR